MNETTGGGPPMLHNTRHSLAVALALALVVSAGGCGLPELLGSLDPPIESEHAAVIEADRGSLHSQLGLYLVLRNRGTVPIRSLTIAFDLYDRDGSPAPGLGENGFSTTFPVVLGGYERGAWCISLDGVGDDRPGLRVARLRVLEVGFADGSAWRLPGGHLIGDPTPESSARGGHLR